MAHSAVNEPTISSPPLQTKSLTTASKAWYVYKTSSPLLQN